MAKTESTAVTEFINSVRRQPVDGYGTRREMSIRNSPAEPAASPPAVGTPAPEWSTPPAARARGTMPPSARSTATMAPPPIPSRATASRPAVRAPSQLIVPPHLQATPAELELIDDTAEQPKVELAAVAAPAVTGPVERTWFDAPQEQIDALDIPDFGTEDDDDLDVSIDFERPARRKIGLVALGGLVVAGGVAAAAYIAFSGGGMQRSAPAAASEAAPVIPSAAPAATPVAPAAAPAVIASEAAEPAPVVPTGIVLHRANFTSEPAGATVTLVMNGRPVVLGAAPVDAQLDPTKSYEVVFTMPGRETVLRSVVFDDSGTIAMNAALGEANTDDPAVAVIEPEPEAVEPEPEAVEPEPEPAPVARKATRKKTRSAHRETRRSSRSARSKKTAATSMPRGAGVLMLNAKPPCDIVIDGKPTGKKTPQRALTLSPGKHRIGLVNKTYGIKASFTVSIKAGEKKRVIKDMTDRM